MLGHESECSKSHLGAQELPGLEGASLFLLLRTWSLGAGTAQGERLFPRKFGPPSQAITPRWSIPGFLSIPSMRIKKIVG
jgi:hypothetical protein